MIINCICGTNYEFVPDDDNVVQYCPNCYAFAYAQARFKSGIPLSQSQQLKPEFKSLPDAPNESYISVVSVREKILQDALKIVTQDRNKDYGDPEDNFSTIAEYWWTYLHSKNLFADTGVLTATDVAAMMILMKCSRLATSADKEDHWVDIAGYAACGGQCACKR